MKRITKKEWGVIFDALNMIEADVWDVNSYGKRPDFEAIINKVRERLTSKKVRT